VANENRTFLMQFMAETGSAVTAINWLGRAMQQFPSHAVSAAAETEVAMAELDSALRVANSSATDLSSSFAMMGRNATDMLGAAGAAAKIGIEGEENLTAFAEASRKFGFVTKTSAKDAGQALSDLSIVMGYKTAGDVEKLASGMTFLSRRTNVSTNDLRALMRETGRAAKEVGVTESAVLGFAASFSQQGMSARQAAGPLSAMFKRMQYEPLVFGQAMKLSAEEMDNFAKMTPNKQLEMFMQSLGKMSKTDAEFLLEGMQIASGKLATKMWQAGVQSKNFSKYIGWASEAIKENKALTEEASKVELTLTQQLKEMGYQLKAIFLTAGTLLLPVIKLIVMGLRGLLIVVQAIPSPILAAAAAFSALGAVMLGGVWAANTKMVAGLVDVIRAMGKAYIAVGGLSGMYKKLTFNAVKAAAAQKLAAGKWSTLIGAGGKMSGAGQVVMPPIAPVLTGATTATGAVAKGAATTGLFTTLSAAAAALGVSVAALLGIILAVVAALVLVGVMIYKGVQMMKSAEAQTKAFGLALILATGPIGAMLLGFMAMASVFKRAWNQIVAAMQPLIDLGKKLAPIFYALLLVGSLLNPIVWAVAASFALLYVAIAIGVGMVEAFAEVLLWAFEPFIPLAEELGVLFTWIGEQLGFATDEGTGLWDALKWIGKILGYIVFGPFALLIKAFAMVGDLIVLLATDAGAVGEALAYPFIWLGEVAVQVWEGIVKYFQWSIAQTTKSFSWLGSVFKNLISAMLWGLNKIMSPLKSVWSMFSGIASAAAGVWKSVTGSSPWHIQESMSGEVIPALDKTRQAFDDIADSSFGVMQTARVRRTAAGPTIAPRAATTSERMAPPTTAPAITPESGPKEIRVSVPVTLMLDGMVIGRAVAEQIVQINERLMNPSGYPLRGVEPAY